MIVRPDVNDHFLQDDCLVRAKLHDLEPTCDPSESPQHWQL